MLSLAAHALVVGLLVWRLGTGPTLAESPVMNVELASLPHRAPPPQLRAPPRDRRAAPLAQPRAAPRTPPAEAPEMAPAPVPEPASGARSGVVQTLRGLLGCEHARLLGLSAQEREWCRERQTADAARLRDAPAQKLNLDRRGDFTPGSEPYLNAMPTNGCKPRASRDVAPSGKEGAKASVTCVVPF